MSEETVPPRLSVENPQILARTELDDGRVLTVRLAEPGDVSAMLAVIHASFRARELLGQPPAALADTADSVLSVAERRAGVVVTIDGRIVAACVLTLDDIPILGRVSVLPEYQGQGVARAMVIAVIEWLAVKGYRAVDVFARVEFPRLVQMWQRRGFVSIGQQENLLRLRRVLPVVVEVPAAADMQALGRRIAQVVRAGDVIIASGELGAGKTTLAQGIGQGLGVEGPVLSPTFVLARIHPAKGDGPQFVHVDAYRLGSVAELDDLDLLTSMDSSVTLIEWGAGIAEGLSPAWLMVDIRRGLDPEDDTRWVFLSAVGDRWAGVLEGLAR